MGSLELTIRKYRELRFASTAEALGSLLTQAEANELSYLQFAEQLVDHEISCRQHKRIDLNHRKAAFPMIKSLEEFDYRHQTTITKRQVSRSCYIGQTQGDQELDRNHNRNHKQSPTQVTSAY